MALNLLGCSFKRPYQYATFERKKTLNFYKNFNNQCKPAKAHRCLNFAYDDFVTTLPLKKINIPFVMRGILKISTLKCLLLYNFNKS